MMRTSRFVRCASSGRFSSLGGIWTSRNPIAAERRNAAREEELAEQMELAQARRDRFAEQEPTMADMVPHHSRGGRNNVPIDFVPYGGQFPSFGGSPDVDEGPPIVVPEYGPATASVWPRGGVSGLLIDIDGVVLRGDTVIDGSREAILLMEQHRIPFVFLTNSGAAEASKAEELSRLLETKIPTEALLTAHSPMRLLVPKYADKTVLVVGCEGSVDIARSYGFLRAISVGEYVAHQPDAVPLFWKGKGVRPPAPRPHPPPCIDAVFVMDVSPEWGRDVQVVLDVLIGASPSTAQTVPVYLSADDLFYSASHPLPRLYLGAFRESLCHLHECVTGRELNYIPFGKPRAIAFEYAKMRLRSLGAQRYGFSMQGLKDIFMVGDNILTDITGGNANACCSVFVTSGAGGRYVPATRPVMGCDEEGMWLEDHVSAVPHYVAPSLMSFVQELLTLPKDVILMNMVEGAAMPPNPVDLRRLYSFDKALELSKMA